MGQSVGDAVIYDEVGSLSDDYEDCEVSVGEVALFVQCADMFYLYEIDEVLSTALHYSSDFGDNDPDTFGAWLSHETGYEGALVYITNDIEIYRVYKDSSDEFQNEEIFTISQGIGTMQTIDLFDNIAIVRFNDNTFRVIQRPGIVGGDAIILSNSELPIDYDIIDHKVYQDKNNDDVITIIVAIQKDQQGFFIEKYTVVDNELSNGYIFDQSQQSIDFGNDDIDSMVISDDFLYLGCSFCNSIYGQVSMYSLDTLEELQVFEGDGDNVLTGLEMAISDQGNYQEIYYSSQYNANASYREYNIGVIQVAINDLYEYSEDIGDEQVQEDFSFTSQQYGALQTVQKVKYAPDGYKKNVKFGVYKNQLFVKSNTLDDMAYVNLCTVQSYYDEASEACVPCSDNQVTIVVQQTYCSTCNNLLSGIGDSSYFYSLYSSQCIDTDDDDDIQTVVEQLIEEEDEIQTDTVTDSDTGDSIIDTIVDDSNEPEEEKDYTIIIIIAACALLIIIAVVSTKFLLGGNPNKHYVPKPDNKDKEIKKKKTTEKVYKGKKGANKNKDDTFGKQEEQEKDFNKKVDTQFDDQNNYQTTNPLQSAQKDRSDVKPVVVIEQNDNRTSMLKTQNNAKTDGDLISKSAVAKGQVDHQDIQIGMIDGGDNRTSIVVKKQDDKVVEPIISGTVPSIRRGNQNKQTNNDMVFDQTTQENNNLEHTKSMVKQKTSVTRKAEDPHNDDEIQQEPSFTSNSDSSSGSGSSSEQESDRSA